MLRREECYYRTREYGFLDPLPQCCFHMELDLGVCFYLFRSNLFGNLGSSLKSGPRKCIQSSGGGNVREKWGEEVFLTTEGVPYAPSLAVRRKVRAHLTCS
ncbi:hypothetical protein CY35_01G114200 [Sphagnum magellanicum]|nr:hypothetical protein CY35_01G114200 [Sphagnum magellanicum]